MTEITQDNLKNIIRNGESETLEFKASFNDEAIESIGSFANAHGGTVLIGVNDEGNIIGISVGKKTIEDIANMIQNSTDPRLQPSIMRIESENKSIIAVQISMATTVPISVRGRYFRRVGKTNQRMSHEEIMQRFMTNSSRTWDMAIEPQTSIRDLDSKQIANYILLVKNAGRQPIPSSTSDLIFLRKMGLINEENIPTRAALLLFGLEPNRYFPSAYLKVGRFKTPTIILDDREFHGTLIDQLDGVMGWFRDKLETKFVITGNPQRDVVWEYPLDAIREVVINAIIHRDYNIDSDCQIKLYDDHLDIWNPGTLSPLLTPESLFQEHASIHRNRKIAEAFFYAGLIEKWGSGTIRVAEKLQASGMPLPKFSLSNYRFHVSFYKTTENISVQSTNLTQRQQKIIKVFDTNENGLKLSELLLVMEEKIADRTLRDDLSKLQKLGLVRISGRGKNARWSKINI